MSVRWKKRERSNSLNAVHCYHHHRFIMKRARRNQRSIPSLPLYLFRKSAEDKWISFVFLLTCTAFGRIDEGFRVNKLLVIFLTWECHSDVYWSYRISYSSAVAYTKTHNRKSFCCWLEWWAHTNTTTTKSTAFKPRSALTHSVDTSTIHIYSSDLLFLFFFSFG